MATWLNRTSIDTYDPVRPHGEEIRHESGKARSQAALSDETELQFRQTDGVVSSLPIPARNVQQIGLNEKKKKKTKA